MGSEVSRLFKNERKSVFLILMLINALPHFKSYLTFVGVYFFEYFHQLNNIQWIRNECKWMRETTNWVHLNWKYTIGKVSMYDKWYA